MSAFAKWGGHLDIEGTDDYLTQSLGRWEVGKLGSGLYIDIPAGFRFNLSIPGSLTAFQCRHDPRALNGAALHDWLVYKGYRLDFAAAEMRAAWRACGIGAQRAWVGYHLVFINTVHVWD